MGKNVTNRIIKNASWIIGCRIVQSFISMIIGIITARYLGPSNFGLINYANSFVTFFIPIMNLGLTNTLVQEMINDPDKEGEILGTSLGMCLTSAIMCIFGVSISTYILNPGEKETLIVCVLYSTILISQALEIIIYWFQTHLLSKISSVISIGTYFTVAIYKVFLLVSHKSVYWFALSQSLDCFLTGIALLAAYHLKKGQKFSLSMQRGKQLFSKSKYYIVSMIMVACFAQTDKVMLKLMVGVEYTGIYSAAVVCASMTSFVFSAIIDSFRPVIFEAMTFNKELFNRRMVQLYGIVIYLSLIQCIVITGFAHFIIIIIYGNAYAGAVSALRIIVWYSTFSYIGAIRDIWLLAYEKQSLLWRINIIGALLNVVLNIVFIPLWSINGAAFASLITQIVTNVILGFIIKPIRDNNKLLMEGINPKVLVDLMKNSIIKLREN